MKLSRRNPPRSAGERGCWCAPGLFKGFTVGDSILTHLQGSPSKIPPSPGPPSCPSHRDRAPPGRRAGQETQMPPGPPPRLGSRARPAILRTALPGPHFSACLDFGGRQWFRRLGRFGERGVNSISQISSPNELGTHTCWVEKNRK